MLKILIVGEFSSFAKNLKKGFTTLGHSAIVVHTADGFKAISNGEGDVLYKPSPDISLFGFHIPKSQLLMSILENWKLSRAVYHRTFDFIIIINETFVSFRNTIPGVKFRYIQKQKSVGAKIIYTSCGRDVANRLYTHEMKYFVERFPNGIEPKVTQKELHNFINILNISDIVIPTGYDYLYTIKSFCREYCPNVVVSKEIPLPIAIEDFNYQSCIGRKINILHGIIRAQQKGSPYFLAALEIIEKKYPDKIKINIVKKLPFSEYMKILECTDILLDQNTSYCLGMNAEIGLMMGKVVLGGNEPEEIESLGVKSPVINVIPNVEQIVGELENLINSPELIDRIKIESRNYAIKYLDASLIAKKYLNLLYS